MNCPIEFLLITAAMFFLKFILPPFCWLFMWGCFQHSKYQLLSSVMQTFPKSSFFFFFLPWPISGQCSHFIFPENTRKPKVFSVFRVFEMRTWTRNGLTHYSPVLLIYTPWKHQKTLGFLFSGGIDKQHQAVMG